MSLCQIIDLWSDIVNMKPCLNLAYVSSLSLLDSKLNFLLPKREERMG